MRSNARWRRHAELAAKQMHVMAEITKSLGRHKKIPLGTSVQIQTFMHQGYLQEKLCFFALTTILSDTHNAG
jgi:hypothetical protein